MELNFKVWLEREFDPAMMRDIRLGYDMRRMPAPGAPAAVAGQVVSGLGNVFRKRMGQGFPGYGSGYHGYFDDMYRVFANNQSMTVVKYEPYQEGDNVRTATQTAHEHIMKNEEIQQAATNAGVDLKYPSKISHEIDKEHSAVKITFNFKFNQKTSDRLQMRRIDPDQQAN